MMREKLQNALKESEKPKVRLPNEWEIMGAKKGGGGGRSLCPDSMYVIFRLNEKAKTTTMYIYIGINIAARLKWNKGEKVICARNAKVPEYLSLKKVASDSSRAYTLAKPNSANALCISMVVNKDDAKSYKKNERHSCEYEEYKDDDLLIFDISKAILPRRVESNNIHYGY